MFAHNGAAGVQVLQNASNVFANILMNSFFDNAEIAIDLRVDGDTFLNTPNDIGDADDGPNDLLNFPVIESVTPGNTTGTVVVRGFAPAGADIDFYIADRVTPGFGQGKTYLTTFTEGSADDADATTGDYSDPNFGEDTGANRFEFVLSGLPTTSALTAVARLNQMTSEFGYTTSLDSDDDQVPDLFDVDDDNDGIPDVDEGGAAGDPNADADDNGIPAYLDVENGVDSNDDGIVDAFDTDMDGIPNHLDVDSDGDGILDAIEGFDTSPAAGDGVADVMPNGFDENGNGWDDAYEAAWASTPPDHDSDTIADFLDADDDGDGLLSIYEPGDSDEDGIPDYLDTDDDGDGVLTADENADPNEDGNPDDALNTNHNDSPDLPDYLDPTYPMTGCTVDADCSGTPDTPVCNTTSGVCEAAPTACTVDADCSGTPSTPVCNTTSGVCEAAPTACTVDADCSGTPSTPVCNTTSGVCEAAPTACTVDTDCSGTPNTPVCDTVEGMCVAQTTGVGGGLSGGAVVGCSVSLSSENEMPSYGWLVVIGMATMLFRRRRR
ncbi:MAG: hypothetical protein R3A47_08455 [Polyangiales bacterium]